MADESNGNFILRINISKYPKIYNNFNNVIYLFRIIYLISLISITLERQRNEISFSSKIDMIINGRGEQILLNNSFYLPPSEIWVNGNKKESCRIFCDMEYEENNVTLIFNDPVNSTEAMFSYLNNIKEIDLSHFDFSQVTSMENMFGNCYNLEKINFGYINTSSVVNMKWLFYKCIHLLSLDVSNFNTSKVFTMQGMFYNCSSLPSINISNFNTSNIKSFHTFLYKCKELTSIDLSSFNTSKATDMTAMFCDCSNLRSINVSNFNTSKVKLFKSIFSGCSKLISLNISNFDTTSAINLETFFRDCSGLSSIDIANFNTKNVESLKGIFYRCENIEFLDVTLLDTSKVKNMSYLFYGCKKLKSLNLLNFNTSLVENMVALFYECFQLEILDLTNFDTSSVTYMGWMFYSCTSLRIIKFPEIFNTSKVGVMREMFCYCNSLIALNLSSFDTKKVTDMRWMFTDCLNLKYLDISHFSPIRLNFIYQMFNNMSSLIYLNINSIEIHSGTRRENTFDNLPPNLKICSTKTNMTNFLLSYNKTINCSDICFDKNIKIDPNTKECIYSCSDIGYTYEFNNICLNECPDGTHIMLNNISNKNNVFVEFENGVAICLDKNPKGYYLSEDNFYEKCYENCEFCYGPGNKLNNNCKKCISNFTFINEIKYKNNCFVKCKYNYYFNDSNNYICTENDNCPKNYNKFIFEKLKCIDKCENDDTYKYEYNSICYKECPDGTIRSSKKNYFCFGEKNIFQIDLVNNEEIHQLIVDNLLDKYNISNGEEMIYQGENNFFFQITNTENELSILEQKINNTNIFSIIDLGKCENLLKNHYEINENISLIIMKYEKISNISSERSFQYEIYEPNNKTKLNLSVCNNLTIDIYKPVILSEKIQNLYNQLKELGYDLFDINSPFYNDICTPYKSLDNTDVLLSDRVNFYFYNDDTSCQSNCKFSDYLFESNYLKCKCDIKNSEINTYNAESFSAKSIYQSFYKVLQYSNYKVLQCYKLAFTFNNIITENLGSIFTIAYFLFYLLFFIIYVIKGNKQLKLDFSKNIIMKAKEKQNKSNLEKYKKLNHKHKIKKRKNNKNSKKIKENCKNNKKMVYHNPPKKKISIHIRPRVNLMSEKNIHIGSNTSENTLIHKQDLNKNLILFNKDINKYDQSKNHEFDNYELNNLEYYLSKIFDKRNFFQIYWSFIKRENLVIFTFITTDDHNITFVKYSRFFFLLCTDMAMNVFFFSDETMHKMFLNYGKYNFIQQIPQIIYSTAVSQIIETFICFLSLTDIYFYEIKKCKQETKNTLMKIITKIKVKLAFFYVFTLIMFIFYWYLITCFCAVYKNTQIAFIKDFVSSFILGIFWTFVLYIFPTIFRKISLKSNSGIECVYKFSNIIPIF